MNNTKQVITKEGTVIEIQAGDLYRVEMDDGTLAWGSRSGKMRKFRIKLIVGDRVKVEFSPHDLARGRIAYRVR